MIILVCRYVVFEDINYNFWAEKLEKSQNFCAVGAKIFVKLGHFRKMFDFFEENCDFEA